VDYDDLPETRPASDIEEYLRTVVAALRRASELRREVRFPSIPPVAAVVAAAAIVTVVGCADGDLSGIVGSIPGVVAALAVAIRAQAKIRVADSERERIAAIAHAEAVEAMSDAVRGMRADLDTAAAIARDAIARERACEERVRTVDARCEALAAELAELRRAALSGHTPAVGLKTGGGTTGGAT
jgi:hypothetical protein